MNSSLRHTLAILIAPALVTFQQVMADGLTKADWYAVGAAFIGGIVAWLSDSPLTKSENK